MIMRSNQCSRFYRSRYILENRPSQSQSVVGRCSASQFIENDETLSTRIIDNICNFNHLSHKGRLIFRDHVTTSDTSKDSIH